jgi:hypothetical protein
MDALRGRVEEERRLSSKLGAILDTELRNHRLVESALDAAVATTDAPLARLEMVVARLAPAVNRRCATDAKSIEQAAAETAATMAAARAQSARQAALATEAMGLRRAARRDADAAAAAAAVAERAEQTVASLQEFLGRAVDAAAVQRAQLDAARRDVVHAREEVACLAAFADAMYSRTAPAKLADGSVGRAGPAQSNPGPASRPPAQTLQRPRPSAAVPMPWPEPPGRALVAAGTSRPLSAQDAPPPPPPPGMAKVAVSLELAGRRFAGHALLPVPAGTGAGPVADG